MLDELATHERRQQMPVAQLTWLVAAVSGNKSKLKDWYTGHAVVREDEARQNGVPEHLQRALEVGIAQGTVSDAAFATFRMLREEG